MKLDPKKWDDVDTIEPFRRDCYTFLDYFEKIVKERPNDSYLGSRVKLNEKEFGGYEWMSYKQVENIC